MNMHIDLLNPFKESRFLGMNYLTLKLHDDLAIETCNSAQNRYGIPVTDLIRFGGRDMVETIIKAMDEWS